MSEASEKVNRWLDDASVRYISHTHPAVFSVDEADEHTGHIEGVAAKTLLVFGEKTKAFYLISLEGHKKLSQAAIKTLLGERVRFAKSEDLGRILNVVPGSVSPLGLIFDTESEIRKYVIDKEILEADFVTWHPNDNTQTYQFDQENMGKVLNMLGHEIVVYTE